MGHWRHPRVFHWGHLSSACGGSLWALLLLIVAQPTDVAAQPPVRIGEINSYSGIAAGFTLPYRQAVEMAVEEINAAGGLLGRCRGR